MSLATPENPTKWAIQRWPTTDDELYYFIQAVWGKRIPRYSVCPGHCSPFEAFAEAYFARAPVAIWKASRGFGGKTDTLSTLVNTEAVCLAADSSILGGSAAQSLNVHAASLGMWHHPTAPRHLLAQEPTKYDTYLNNGAYIRSLMASQTSVRGPHPQRLRMDEIDEMELSILEAAQGQPMRKRKQGQVVETQTVLSSTHQYPDKTFSVMWARAIDLGWARREWCYRESANPIDGWLTMDEIQRQKGIIPKAMWEAEYDLQEPSFEGRAIDPEAVDQAFVAGYTTEEMHWRLGGKYKLNPKPVYITAVDWAKNKDMTVVTTFDCSMDPWRCVEIQVFNKLPWPVTVKKAEQQYARFAHGIFIHDNTGLGQVITDFFDDTLIKRQKFLPFTMTGGQARQDLFSEYIAAIEGGHITFPRVDYVYKEHKYVTNEDLFKSGGHPPDSVVSGALAWWARRKLARGIGAPQQYVRSSSPWNTDALVV